jgi:hypothetical protein
MADKLDLKELKKEISDRKKAKPDVSEGSKVAKDAFLHNLQKSLETGQMTEAAKRIKAVDQGAANKIIAKKGGIPSNTGTSPSMSEALAAHGGSTVNSSSQETSDRDDLLYEEFKRKQNELLNGVSAGNNSGIAQVPQVNLNEAVLNESVKKIINENFAHIVGEAMKDTIIEIYSVEKMKEVMLENRDLIRKVVIETIRELQNKKKPQS